MKKSIFMTAAAAALVMLGACTTKDYQKGDDTTSTKVDREEVYTGVIPAADCDGIRMTVHLDFDDDAKDGDFKMVETYFNNDSTATGTTDINTFTSEGDFTVGQKGTTTYYKLVADTTGAPAGPGDVTYFVVDSDSTITLANQDLEVSQAPGMNYTLKVSK